MNQSQVAMKAMRKADFEQYKAEKEQQFERAIVDGTIFKAGDQPVKHARDVYKARLNDINYIITKADRRMGQ